MLNASSKNIFLIIYIYISSEDWNRLELTIIQKSKIYMRERERERERIHPPHIYIYIYKYIVGFSDLSIVEYLSF